MFWFINFLTVFRTRPFRRDYPLFFFLYNNFLHFMYNLSLQIVSFLFLFLCLFFPLSPEDSPLLNVKIHLFLGSSPPLQTPVRTSFTPYNGTPTDSFLTSPVSFFVHVSWTPSYTSSFSSFWLDKPHPTYWLFFTLVSGGRCPNLRMGPLWVKLLGRKWDDKSRLDRLFTAFNGIPDVFVSFPRGRMIRWGNGGWHECRVKEPRNLRGVSTVR